ncbi:MAG: transporter substrate-binding domain-containing protein, partial [Oscillospiraceae bacterium]
EADGYDVMVAKYLADKMGKELVIKKVEWTGLEPALNAGEIDAIIAGMTDTPERRQNADFTTPYYESDMVMIVRADDPLKDAKTLEDFKGKNVLGQINTMYDEVIDQIPEVKHAVPLASYPLMVVSLQSKDADGITAELPVARGVVASNPDLAIVTFEKGKGFEADTSVSIAVKKGNTELKDALQKALDTLPQDQRLDWMGAAVERQPATK